MVLSKVVWKWVLMRVFVVVVCGFGFVFMGNLIVMDVFMLIWYYSVEFFMRVIVEFYRVN